MRILASFPSRQTGGHEKLALLENVADVRSASPRTEA